MPGNYSCMSWSNLQEGGREGEEERGVGEEEDEREGERERERREERIERGLQRDSMSYCVYAD